MTTHYDDIEMRRINEATAAPKNAFEASVIEQLAELSAKVDKLTTEAPPTTHDETVVRCESCNLLTAKASATRYGGEDEDVFECPACGPSTPKVTLETITPRQILALADAHIRHYQGMQSVNATRTGIRLGEVNAYLGIWTSVREKRGLELSYVEKSEIVDAIDCGDYDELLAANAEPAK
jgi:hypothetical protein